MSAPDLIDILGKTVHDTAFRTALVKNPQAILSAEGVEDQEDIAILMAILTPFLTINKIRMPPPDEMHKIMFTEVKEHYVTLTGLRRGLQETIGQMLVGYGRTMFMYSLSFYVGIGLIVAAVVFAYLRYEPLLPIVFAGLGAADIVGYFVIGPPIKIQESRANLAQLQAAYFIWYQDFRHWGSFLQYEFMKYEQNLVTSAAYRSTLDEVSEVMMKNTDKTLSMIEEYVESTGRSSNHRKQKRNQAIKGAPVATPRRESESEGAGLESKVSLRSPPSPGNP